MESKKPWESKTMWGALIMLISLILGYFKIDIGDPAGWATSITGAISLVMVVVGRVKAVKRIE